MQGLSSVPTSGVEPAVPLRLAEAGTAANDLLLEDEDERLTEEPDELLLDDENGTPERAKEAVVEDKPPVVDETAVAEDAHATLLAQKRYPSATECRTCHEDHYREWSVSPHAYAQLSPVFNAMQGTIVKLTNGTQGDFCIRCHTPIGMQLEEPVFTSNAKRHAISREGVTCIACHRVDKNYGRISARMVVEEGDIFAPVYGPKGNEELKRVLANANIYKVVTEEGERGRPIHTDVERFFALTTPGFCGSCHDVLFPNGFRLEDAFSEYKNSPAAGRGVTCQDCHMGKEPGVVSGYADSPAARIGDVETRPRKRTNHMFIGPDYSIVHPGIFPHNPQAQQFATLEEWLAFDHEAGWGTDSFEDNVPEGYAFPERWDDIDARYEAREILEEQLAMLAFADEERKKLLRAGYQLGPVEVTRADEKGLRFRVQVRNATDGHGVPTGFDAERLVFLQVTVRDREDRVVFRSGDLDPNGDVRDLHSVYVHNGELPLDTQLFSLQSRFITRNARGSEREQVLTINYSASPLPFVRPSTISSILLGRPVGARKQKQVIRANGHRWANYEVKGSQLTGKGPYSANIKLIAGMVPVNLVHEIQEVGFDYGMSPREVADKVVAGHRVLWERDVALEASKTYPAPGTS